MRHVAGLCAPAFKIAFFTPRSDTISPSLQEGIADPDCFIQEPTRVRAKVDDITAWLSACRLIDRCQCTFYCSAGVPLKVLMLMTPMPSLTSHLTGRSSILARTRATSNGLSRPGRTMVTVVLLPGRAAHHFRPPGQVSDRRAARHRGG